MAISLGFLDTGHPRVMSNRKEKSVFRTCSWLGQYIYFSGFIPPMRMSTVTNWLDYRVRMICALETLNKKNWTTYEMCWRQKILRTDLEIYHRNKLLIWDIFVAEKNAYFCPVYWMETICITRTSLILGPWTNVPCSTWVGGVKAFSSEVWDLLYQTFHSSVISIYIFVCFTVHWARDKVTIETNA